MRFNACVIVALATTLVCDSDDLALAARMAEPTQIVVMPRVRSDDPELSDAIVQAAARSITFKRLLDAINATDGLVYVSEGKCRHSARACLHMTLHVAGPHRLLRVVVNRRGRSRCGLMAVIGHELQHALEALDNPTIRSTAALSSYFARIGPTGDRGIYETATAVDVGHAVAREAC